MGVDDGTWDYEINNVLSSNVTTGKYYKGCYSANTIAMPLSFPASLIVNLAEAGKKGTHWIALWLKSPTEAIHFDPYGLQPYGGVLEFLRNFPDPRTTPFVIQSIISKVCADHCIFFVYQCSKGESFDYILQVLGTRINPDVFVYNFTRALLRE